MPYHKPIKIKTLETAGIDHALKAMRLPHKQNTIATFKDDLALASKLIKAGDDHAKALRGIMVWYEMRCQVGWLIEYLTYRVGVDCLSSSSAMHTDLIGLSGLKLAERKQSDLNSKCYTRVELASYQALRRIYGARKTHRHPDWRVFCNWIETLPYFDELIWPDDVR